MPSLNRWTIFIFLGAVSLFAVDGYSQGKEFKYRAGDRKGQTKYIITAKAATPQGPGVMKLDEAKLEVYDQGKVKTTVTADSCIYDRNGNKLDASGRVSMQQDGVTITGEGLIWDDSESTVVVKKDARVAIKNQSMVKGKKKTAKP